MPTINVKRYAKIIDDKMQMTYQFFNEDTNKIENRVQILEDTVRKDVSSDAVDRIKETLQDEVDTRVAEAIEKLLEEGVNAKLSVIVENLSSSLQSNKNNDTIILSTNNIDSRDFRTVSLFKDSVTINKF